MKAKRRVAVLAVLAVLIPALWAVVRAADKPDGSVLQPTFTAEQRDTLRGLRGVFVLVEGIPPEVERLGLTRDALQTDTELQLRQYGIKVLSQQELFAMPGWPRLYINVNVLGADDDKLFLLPGTVLVQCLQNVSLERDPTIRCMATTWHTEATVAIGRARVLEVRGTTKDLVAKFINDYLAANPKEDKVKEESKPKEEAADSKP